MDEMRFRAASLVRIVLPLAVAPLLIAAKPAGSARQAPPPQTGNADKHFLWRATDVPVPFYILGSSHALRANEASLGPVINDAIKQCRRFVFEIDIKHSETEFAEKLRAAAKYPKGVTLKQKVTPKTYEYLRKISRTGPSGFEQYKPWAIAMFMYSHPAYHGISVANGVEATVLRHAGLSAEVGGLETPAEHVHVLSDMSDIEGEVFLLQTLVYSEQWKTLWPEVISAWRHGETHRLARLFAPREREAPYLVQRLVTKRNANWLPKIEAEMRSGKATMIVVGARHLCGPYNVIDMLRARGHKLEQL